MGDLPLSPVGVADRRPTEQADTPPQGSARADGGRPEASPARVVADADVLACDLLVDGDARRALDHVRSHSWVTLVASDHLLDEAEAVLRDLTAGTDPDLAADWRATVETLRNRVDHPPGDHPALASAYAGGAMHLLSFDEGLGSAGAGMALRKHVPVSVRPPDAFAALFDAESLYPEVVGGEYPGPDRDPRD
jgi:predicted nucleic acid-binding protein